MNIRKAQLRKAVKAFFRKIGTKKDKSDLQSRVEQQRSAAQGVGVNPFDLRWSGQERGPMAMVLRKTSPCLPKELRDEIIGFASRPKFIQDFCIDMDTAEEIERILDRDPVLKAAMSKFPNAIGSLLESDSSKEAEHLKAVVAEVLESPAAQGLLGRCVETDIDAILKTTEPHERFIAANRFLNKLAGFGIKKDCDLARAAMSESPDQTSIKRRSS